MNDVFIVLLLMFLAGVYMASYEYYDFNSPAAKSRNENVATYGKIVMIMSVVVLMAIIISGS